MLYFALGVAIGLLLGKLRLDIVGEVANLLALAVRNRMPARRKAAPSNPEPRTTGRAAGA